ncbi:hypothetical protein LAJ19_18495 (plasmid) [Deinococcus taeanensis]|uniref:hypothetical protein n=1 Tax=Deinococcus taeanensis TaxID=2737050 RepID=UPI001CDCDFB9|nr:hypothetical protein [Deinococcus taeanensis]UBV45108.1 hypothetical protein LAJ19_18495 [Deinococcus taeanensis]
MFREAGLSVQHCSHADHGSRASQKALASIKTEHVDFDVYLNATGGAVAPDIVQTAEAVLSRIVELDAAARAVQTDPSYEDFLASVDVTREEIELRYYAGTVNTEWGAFFVRGKHGEFIFDTLG